MNSTFLVDEFSITFLYVSSSDLLKNNNTQDYHFAVHKQYHKQTKMQKPFFKIILEGVKFDDKINHEKFNYCFYCRYFGGDSTRHRQDIQ